MEGSGQIERRAADWLARRDGGEWSPEDAAALQTWLAASTASIWPSAVTSSAASSESMVSPCLRLR